MTEEAPLILIADDEEDVVLLCRVNLEFEGFHVMSAADGVEALDSARERKPDLILLDVMMPRKDGWECLVELKEDPDLKDVPVVLLTAKVQEEHMLHGLAAGATEYVTKPFHPTELIQIIRTILDLTPAERERRRREALQKLTAFRQA